MFTVHCRTDEDGWVATVEEVPGCHTQGKTLEQAQERIREALAVSLDDESTAQDAALIFHRPHPVALRPRVPLTVRLRRLWRRLRCQLGLHFWCYSVTDVDAIGRPTARACLYCGHAQERPYDSYTHSGHAVWESDLGQNRRRSRAGRP